MANGLMSSQLCLFNKCVRFYLLSKLKIKREIRKFQKNQLRHQVKLYCQLAQLILNNQVKVITHTHTSNLIRAMKHHNSSITSNLKLVLFLRNRIQISLEVIGHTKFRCFKISKTSTVLNFQLDYHLQYHHLPIS